MALVIPCILMHGSPLPIYFFRLSAQELLECSFLAVEPDVQLLAADPSHKLLTLQVVFKGSDKVSVKFEFNVASIDVDHFSFCDEDDDAYL